MPFLTQPFSIGERVDSVFLFIFLICVTFLIFITLLMLYFVVKYSRKRNPKAVDIEGHAWLEITWTVVTLGLFLVMFYYGWTNFKYMRNPPEDAMVVEATARQWAWSFKYPNGKQTDEMYVALGRPVKVELRSLDVLHGFYISAFRVKADVVPGQTNFVWFSPALLGTFDVQCTVICGVNHSYMLSKVHVLSEDDFKLWYFGRDGAPEAGEVEGAAAPDRHPGLAVIDAKACLVCHSLDGTEMVGPTFKGLFGRKEIVVAGGREAEVVVDEALIARAIREPNVEVVKGYPPSMPPAALTERELEQVTAYFKTVN